MGNQRILFITGNTTVEPLGIMLLSSIVKHCGHTTDFYMYNSNETLFDALLSFRPTIVGLSMTTGQHIPLLKAANFIKKYDGTIKIIAGGPHVTYFPSVQKDCNIDYIIRGDADVSFIRLVTNLSNGVHPKEKDRSILTLTNNLDSLPFPDRDLVYKYEVFSDNPVRNVMTSRGCPYSCTYCYASSYRELYKGQQIVRYRSPRNIIDECKEVVYKYKTTMIFFADDEFSMNIKRLYELKELYISEIGLPFHCQIRIDILDEERIKLLKEMGCYSLTFAIESGSERIRKQILNRNITDKQIIDGCKRLKKYNIKFRSENMIGLPNETYNEMMETIKLNRKVKPTYAWASIFQPYPNTILGNYCKMHNLYNGDNSDICVKFTEDSVLKMGDKERLVLKNLQRLFSLSVKFSIIFYILRFLVALPYTRCFTKVRDFLKRECYKQIFIGVK